MSVLGKSLREVAHKLPAMQRRFVVGVVATMSLFVGIVGTNTSHALASASVVGVGPGAPITGTIGSSAPVTYYAQIFKMNVTSPDASVKVGWAYCIDIHTGLPIGTTNLSESSWDQARVATVAEMEKIRWIVTNYPADQTVARGDSTEAAAVQAAIWHYSDGFNLTSASPAILSLYQNILQASASQSMGEPTPSLNMQPASRKVLPNEYASFTIRTTASSVNVKLRDVAGTGLGDAKLTTCSSDHTPLGSVLNGPFPKSVCVRRTTEGNAGIEVTATSNLYIGRIFSKPHVQQIVLASNINGVYGRVRVTAGFGTGTDVENHRPVVRVACPSGYKYGKNYTLTATATDADGDAIVQWQWKINGVVQTSGTANNASFTFSFRSAADQVITVRAKDAAGLWGSRTLSCSPANHLPTVSLQCPNPYSLGENATWVAAGVDADGDAIEYFWSVDGEPVVNEGNRLTQIAANQTVSVFVLDARGGSSGKPIAALCTASTTTTTSEDTTTTTEASTTTTSEDTTTTTEASTTTTSEDTTTTTVEVTSTTRANDVRTTTTLVKVAGTTIVRKTSQEGKSAGSNFAFTGFATPTALGFALCLLGLGAVALFVSRRRRHLLP